MSFVISIPIPIPIPIPMPRFQCRGLQMTARAIPYMSVAKKRILMYDFFKSHLSYCPLLLIFYSRSLNNRINKLHERSLHIIYSTKFSTFEELFERDRSVSAHTRNLQTLATEMFKLSKNIVPKILRHSFPQEKIFFNGMENIFLLVKKYRT